MKRILFVCDGNTCRSPMAKVILEQILVARGLSDQFSVDSAAINDPSLAVAAEEAREVIKEMFSQDLLVSHKSKSINQIDIADYDLILTMRERHKQVLPANRTFTLREYAGFRGDIADPWGSNLDKYRKCRDEIRHYLEIGIERIIDDC